MLTIYFVLGAIAFLFLAVGIASEQRCEHQEINGGDLYLVRAECARRGKPCALVDPPVLRKGRRAVLRLVEPPGPLDDVDIALHFEEDELPEDAA